MISADASAEADLILPTPGVSSGPNRYTEETGTITAARFGESGETSADARRASSAFHFPFPEAYPIQIDLMRSIFRAIEERKVGVFESPTGTGKSLSLICAAFTWLELNKRRSQEGKVETSNGEEPDWVVAHNEARRREELTRYEDDLQVRISKAREVQAREKKRAAAKAKAESGAFVKKRRTAASGNDSDSDAFLASDYEEGGSRVTGAHAGPSDDSAYLSPEVRLLMAQLESASGQSAGKARQHWGPGAEGEDEEPETTPKIFYVSRTHSQLSQFVSELRKTSFGREIIITELGRQSETDGAVRSISLGSRKQMCINEDVQRVGAKAGSEAMNERCLELAKGGVKGKKRCEFLPLQDETGKQQVLGYRDRALAQVQDLEDLVALGQTLHTCPYYGARTSARQAHLVTLPYNLLLHPSARASLNVSLRDSIVIVDEAHNLIDTILSVHTLSITSRQIVQARAQIQEYLRRFGGRLKGVNEVHLKLLEQILDGMERFSDEWAAKQAAGVRPDLAGKSKAREIEEILTASQLVKEMGGTLDQINLIQLEGYLKDSQIARKVSGYADKRATKAAEEQEGKGAQRHGVSSISAMHAIESFILSLANRTDDGRVLLTLEAVKQPTKAYVPQAKLKTSVAAKPVKGRGAPNIVEKKEEPIAPAAPLVTFKYQLLNPSEAFKAIVEEARSVILAGGTMEPISDFRHQLLPNLEPERFLTFSCGHIIPAENLLATVVPLGPKGVSLEFKFDNRGDTGLLDELANCLVNFSNVVPHGIVVFLPSYAFLDTAVARWKESGVLTRIAAKKKVFFEPKLTADVDEVLRVYTLAIDAPAAGAPAGALLLAVVGAKLSEGINFSDRLARAVVMVGLPFANTASVELKERMSYVRKLAQSTPAQPGVKAPGDAGQELYVNLCMKAVNQSIGRAIRHRNDYAALILLDRRYARPDIKNRLPGWIRNETQAVDRFGPAMASLGAFFRAKRK